MGHYVRDCPKAKADNNKKGENTSGSVQKGNAGKGQMRQGRVFALVPGDTQNAEAVVSGILLIFSANLVDINE